MDVLNAPPNDTRNFVHKRLFGAAKGFVTSGFNPLGAIGGFTAASQTRKAQKRRAAATKFGRPTGDVFRSPGLQIGRTHAERLRLGQLDARGKLLPQFGGIATTIRRAITGPDTCLIPGQRRDQFGNCSFFVGEQLGRDDQAVGNAVMGQYGAGLAPGNQIVDRAVCLRGMVLGNDGICYNKSQISNKERQWPRGRRPLLTGGDMRAISTAARAGRRLTGATKRLQKIGLMKKPTTRRISQAQAHHALKP